jgi:hypothetical protein
MTGLLIVVLVFCAFVFCRALYRIGHDRRIDRRREHWDHEHGRPTWHRWR